MLNLKNKNLLILCPSYPNKNDKFYWGVFVKEYVNSIKKYFNKVYIISPIPFWLYSTDKEKLCSNYSYDNIEVYYPWFFHLPIDYFRNRIWDNQLKIIKQLINKKNINFNIIHSHFTWPCGYIWVKLKHIYNKPLIVTWHWTDIRDTFKWSVLLTRNKLDYVVANSDRIHTNHEELYDLLINNYSNVKEKIVFTYKWIDINKFNRNNIDIINSWSELISNLWIQNKFIVLFLWNLNNFKDPMTFVKMAKLFNNNNEFVFLLAGKWNLSSDINKYISENNLCNIKVLWPRTDTNVLYYISDVFCALSPYENMWSTTIQEAFCIWLPCIISDVWYTSLILKHKKDCLIIPAKNPKKLANQIIELHNHVDINNEIILNLKEWRKKFNSKTLSVENINKLYINI
jgi:glycosyltransferase involved in cell wall biosynthesis